MGLIRRLNPGLLLFVLVILAFFGYPLIMLVVGAFLDGQPGRATGLTLDGFRAAYTDPQSWITFRNSVVFAIGVQVMGIIGGFIFAWIAVRTNAPLRRGLTVIMVAIFAIPLLFFAISWGMLTSPGGLVTMVAGIGADGSPRIDAYSWPGLILVTGLKTISLMYLLLLGPVRAMNTSLEEAAQIAGAGRWRRMFDINIPILLPTLTGLAIFGIVHSLGQLDVALILGVPAGIYVFPSRIYDYLSTTPIQYNAATALSLLLILIVTVLLLVQRLILRDKDYVTVGGKATAQKLDELGWLKWVATAVIVLYTVLALVLPLAQLIVGSFQPVLGIAGFTLDNYANMLSSPSVNAAFRNTLVIGVVGGLIAAALATAVGYLALRGKHFLAQVPEYVVWIVVAVPGIVLALAISWAYLSAPGLKTLYATIWIVMIALIIVVTPLAARATGGALAQLGVELEEASRVAGASRLTMIRTIVVPLIRPSFLVAWFISGLIAAGNLDVPILLSSPDSETVSMKVYQQYTVLTDGAGAATLLIMLLISLALGGVVLAAVNAVMTRLTRRRALAKASA